MPINVKYSAVFKRSTIPIFKSHGMVQARIADCATETFSAIRTVSISNYFVHTLFSCVSLYITHIIYVFCLSIWFCFSLFNMRWLSISWSLFENFPFFLQVRSFGGERRQISMFNNLVSFLYALLIIINWETWIEYQGSLISKVIILDYMVLSSLLNSIICSS